ncbi:hypothetical protein KIPB_008046, partial [Kipferlia bialata]|eukprot:g8046.t1
MHKPKPAKTKRISAADRKAVTIHDLDNALELLREEIRDKDKLLEGHLSGQLDTLAADLETLSRSKADAATVAGYAESVTQDVSTLQQWLAVLQAAAERLDAGFRDAERGTEGGIVEARLAVREGEREMRRVLGEGLTALHQSVTDRAEEVVSQHLAAADLPSLAARLVTEHTASL